MRVLAIIAHLIANVDSQEFLDLQLIGVLAQNVVSQDATYELSGRKLIAGFAKACGMLLNRRQRRMQTCNALKRKERTKMQSNIASEAVSRRDVVDLTSAKIAKVAAFAPEYLYEPLPSKKTASDK